LHLFRLGVAPHLTDRDSAFSFGLPLLSDNPAPLSSLFHIPVLTKGSPGT
jgi:hypothetical protein